MALSGYKMWVALYLKHVELKYQKIYMFPSSQRGKIANYVAKCISNKFIWEFELNSVIKNRKCLFSEGNR